MKKTWLALLIGITGLSFACGPKADGVVLASTPLPAGSSAPVRIEPPTAAMSLSMSAVEWSPAIVGGTQGQMLTEALRARKAIMVIRGDRMVEDQWDEKVFRMVQAASPSTQIVARDRRTLDTILLEHGEIPYYQSWKYGGVDVLGRPWMIPEDHPLRTEWLSKKPELKGAEAMLMIDIIKVDAPRLSEMRKERRGGCEALEEGFNRFYSETGSYFQPLIDAVNPVLAKEFSRQLKEALPFWKAEIATALTGEILSSPRARCLRASSDFLKNYELCADGPCPLAPALHVRGGGLIGMEVSGAALVDGVCPAPDVRDYVAEVIALGARPVADVLPAIPEQWASALAQLRAISVLHSGISDLCEPAHRRYNPDGLLAARSALASFMETLEGRAMTGVWQLAEGRERIAGVGSVAVAARANVADSAVLADTDALLRKIQELDRCRDSRRRPVLVSLVDVSTAVVYFSATMFEEQIFCEDLAPGIP